jgi:hypothetical protein
VVSRAIPLDCEAAVDPELVAFALQSRLDRIQEVHRRRSEAGRPDHHVKLDALRRVWMIIIRQRELPCPARRGDLGNLAIGIERD